MPEPAPLKWWQSLLTSALPNIYVGVAIAALLVLAAYISSEIVGSQRADPTYKFIGIVILFMTALTVAATIFVGLKLANPLEAFGLPAGSMRALLAIGVMILFVVFWLPMIGSDGETQLERKGGTLAADQLTSAVQLHPDQSLRVHVIEYGSPTTRARFETFGRADLRSPEEVDFGKQILTALITLLTSVISFYFGSRSVADATRPVEGGANPAAPADLTALRKQIEAAAAPVHAAVLEAARRIDTLKADPATAADIVRKAALEQADPLRQAAETAREELDRHIRAADAALVSLNTAAGAEERKQLEVTAREQLQKASDALKRVEGAQKALTETVSKIQ